jgi:hypothetical protein
VAFQPEVLVKIFTATTAFAVVRLLTIEAADRPGTSAG